MICIPITATTQGAILADMTAAAKVADLVELRLDFARGYDLKALIESRPCPVIVTNRPVREGGKFEGPEAERLAVLQQAIALGAEYVDVELDSVETIRRGGRTQLIVSHHDFEKTPADLAEIHGHIVRSGADIAKVACMASDIRDTLRLFDLLRNTRHETIALCMGEAGAISRILGRKFRNFLTFASLRQGAESAPGQITADDLTSLYHYKQIGPDTAIYGVIANPVAHSMSPAILNAAFEAAGLDAVYLPMKVTGDVVAFVEAFKAIDVQGYSVTLPHKEAIIAAMDEVDGIVKATGALNTVVNRDGKLFGANTDVPGVMRALEEAIEFAEPQRAQRNGSVLAEKRVLLLGAGGAARALVYGLKERGAEVTIANRTHARAVKLADALGCAVIPLDRIAEVEADILINTTSVGMHQKIDATPAPRAALRPGMIVFDAVYNPPETRLLRDAQEVGCIPVSGIAWFVNQAALQFETWTHLPAPREVMDGALRKRLALNRQTRKPKRIN